MRKALIDSLEEAHITDKEIKTIIKEVFENKFAFMSKSNYLRWLNGRTLSKRIKELTVEMMNEEYKKENPTHVGAYFPGRNHITFRDENIDRYILGHESNHMMTDFTPENGDPSVNEEKRFCRFLNEGITEYLARSEAQKKDTRVYEFNVRFVHILYSVFGDELIKNYIASVSPEFKKKLSEYLECDIKDFYKLCDDIHDKLYPKANSKTTLKETLDNQILKLKNLVVNLVKNSIKKEMLDLKFYTNGKINYVLLFNTIHDRWTLIKELFHLNSKESKDLFRELFIEGLKSSYLSKYKDIDIEDFISRNTHDNKWSVNKMKEEEESFDIKDSMLIAINMKLDSYDYYSKGGFDISMFMLDFYTLVNEGYSNINQNDKSKLLYELLSKKLRSPINMELVNNLISKYDELYSSLAGVRTNNRKTTSESKYYDITKYIGIRSYIEKRDNEFYFVKYDMNKKEFVRKGVGFWNVNPGNKEYPRCVEFYDRDGSHTEYYRICFDEFFDKFMYIGKELECKSSINDVLDDIAATEVDSLIDYNKYNVLFKKRNNYSDVPGIQIVGRYIDENIYIADYKMLFDDLKSIIPSLNSDLSYKIIKQSIDSILRKTYGNMIIPDNTRNNLYSIASSYILNNNIERISELDTISKELIELYTKYSDEAKKEYLVGFDSEESHAKFKKLEEDKDKREYVRQLVERSRDYASSHYMNFIKKENSNYYSTKRFCYGINGSYVNINYDLTSPKGEEIDFELLINCLKEIVNNEPSKEKTRCFNKYYGNLEKHLFGECNINKYSSIQDTISTIEELIKQSVLYDKEPNIDDLNSLFSALLEQYNSVKDEVLSKFDKSKVVVPSDVKQIYESIWRIDHDETKREDVKTELISDLSRTANEMLSGTTDRKEIEAIRRAIEEHRKKYEEKGKKL